MAFIFGAVKEWAGIQQFPNATKNSLVQLLDRLKQKEKDSLTILVLGKAGVGKSSTVNSIFGERICSVSSFQSESIRPVLCSRVCAGFTINIFDTPGLVESGSVSDHAIDTIQRFLLDKTVDAMLYVDRLDDYRVTTLDTKVIKAITRAFGTQIWKVASLVFTHAQVASPDGVEYTDFVAKRTASLLDIVKKESGLKTTDTKILPDGTVWLVKLVETIVQIVESGAPPVVIDQKLIEGPDYNRRWKPWIPLVFLLQVFLVIRPLHQSIKEDAEGENKNRPTWELSAEEYVRRGALKASLEKQARLRRDAARGKGISDRY